MDGVASGVHHLAHRFATPVSGREHRYRMDRQERCLTVKRPTSRLRRASRWIRSATRAFHGGGIGPARLRQSAAHSPPRGADLLYSARDAHRSSRRGDADCIARGFGLPSPRGSAPLPKQRKRGCELVAAPAGLEKFFEEGFYPLADCPDAPPMTEAFLGKLLAAASKCGLEFLPPA